MKFKIKYAMGGGFGGLNNVDWEEIEANNLNDATNYAEEMAKEVYESYAGTNGVMSWDDIHEENLEYDEESINDLYNEAIEGWINYIAKEI